MATGMLRIETIHSLEDFFHAKKMVTLDAIGRDPSAATTDIYIRGFFRQIMERVQEVCPELRPTPIPFHRYESNPPYQSRMVNSGGYQSDGYMPQGSYVQSAPIMTSPSFNPAEDNIFARETPLMKQP